MEAIPKELVLRSLRSDNPWWGPPHEIQAQFARWAPRVLFKGFAALLHRRDVHRAIVLLGPRRVGKTVLIHHAIRDALARGIPPKRLCYISIDVPTYSSHSLAELLDLYLEAAGLDSPTGSYIFIDEVQYLRDWERHLKTLVDRRPDTKFVVSGSAAAALRRKSQESGAGRFTDYLLPPLTFHEFLELSGYGAMVSVEQEESDHPNFLTPDIERLNLAFADYINFGGYPESATNPDIRKDTARFIKSDIVDKVLLRDLPSLYGIQDIQELNRLLTVLAYNTGGEVSLESLSKNSGVAKPTIKKYLDYLSAAFLVRIVKRVDQDARTFARQRNFKVYLTNPAIRCALFGPDDPDSDSFSKLVETAIYSQWFHSDTVEKLYFARWPQGEVDIVHLSGAQAIWGVEVKWSDSAHLRSDVISRLAEFVRRTEVESLTITTRTVRCRHPVGALTAELMPSALYCYAVGFNLVRERTGSIASTEA